MREHLRELISQARRSDGSRMNGMCGETTRGRIEVGSQEAIRLARMASSIHLSQAARLIERTAPNLMPEDRSTASTGRGNERRDVLRELRP